MALEVYALANGSKILFVLSVEFQKKFCEAENV